MLTTTVNNICFILPAMKFGERIEHALQEMQWGPKDLEQRTGVADSTISALTRRGSDRTNYKEAIIKGFPPERINHEWLRNETGSMTGHLWLPGQGPDADTLFLGMGAHQRVKHDAGPEAIDLLLSLKYLTNYMQGLDPSDRKAAMVQIASLADEPERCAKVAASIQAMAATGFAKTGQKVA